MTASDGVLVFGAGGQLGRELIKTLPDGLQLTTADRARCDIADPQSVDDLLREINPGFVINAAAYTAVDRAETEADAAHQANAVGPGVLASACAARGARLLHVSTDFVFDGQRSTPYPPEAETRPLGVYGASKRAGEVAVLESGADAVVLRTGWVYAAEGGNFVHTMLRLMAEREALNVVEDQVGTPTWARGLAEVCWDLVRNPKAFGVLHWSDAGACSWYDFAVAIREEAEGLGLLTKAAARVSPIPASEYPTPATRPAYSVLDKSTTRALIGSAGQHWWVQLRCMLLEVSAAAQKEN